MEISQTAETTVSTLLDQLQMPDQSARLGAASQLHALLVAQDCGVHL